MKKIVLLFLFILIVINCGFSQSIEVFEHSNDIDFIYEKFTNRIHELFVNYNYFDSGIEFEYFPELNNDQRNIIGDDNFYILWLHGSGIVDLDILYLCNKSARESVVFIFQKEAETVFIPCSLDAINQWILYQRIKIYYDEKWH
jgi:hypothetical protein